MPDMDETEARRRFLTARVARLATVDAEGRPHLVPVVFAVLGDELRCEIYCSDNSDLLAEYCTNGDFKAVPSAWDA